MECRGTLVLRNILMAMPIKYHMKLRKTMQRWGVNSHALFAITLLKYTCRGFVCHILLVDE